MKTCSLCGIEKDVSEFYKNCKSNDGLQKHCKLCHKGMVDKWDEKNKDRKKAYNKLIMREYRKRHPEKVKELNKKYRLLNGAKHRATRNEKSRLKRIEILNKYGGKCGCCGESDHRFLCFDHKNNDGYQHRKSGEGRAGDPLFKWIITNNYPDTIRILCFNCN